MSIAMVISVVVLAGSIALAALQLARHGINGRRAAGIAVAFFCLGFAVFQGELYGWSWMTAPYQAVYILIGASFAITAYQKRRKRTRIQ